MRGIINKDLAILFFIVEEIFEEFLDYFFFDKFNRKIWFYF